MSRYFFLSAMLPPLQVKAASPIHFEELLSLLMENLSRSDLKQVTLLRSEIDVKNFPKLFAKKELDCRGNCNEKELDEAFVNQEGFPPFLFEALEAKDAGQAFPVTLLLFFREMERISDGFLKEYFRFEREWRLLIAAFRAKRSELPLEESLIRGSSDDPLLSYILAQKDSTTFDFPFEYRELGQQVKEAQKDPSKEYQAIGNYRFEWIEERIKDAPFSLDYLLGYLVQLMIIEDTDALNKLEGNKRLDEMMHKAEKEQYE